MRHGQTMLNRFNRIQGWVDSPLTKAGEKECYHSGLGLVDLQFDEVITSDLSRTINSARIAMKENRYYNGDLPTRMPEFREFYFGAHEGLEAMPVWARAFEEMNGQPRTIQRTLDAFHTIDPAQEAENYEKFWGRIQQGLNQVVKKHEGKDANVLIVTHALTIDCLVMSLFPDYQKDGLCNNASITNVVYQDGDYQIKTYNDCSHFVTTV